MNSPQVSSNGLIADEAAVTEELNVFTGLGGATVVDPTTAELTPGAAPDAGDSPPPPGASRDPANVLAVQRVAETTGLHVVLGTGHYRDPFLDRDWFDRHGADAIGHCDTVTAPGYAEQIARRGAYVGIDTINTDHAGEVDRRVRMVLELVRAGYIDSILLSHDVCLLSQLRAHGGGGYGFVHTRFREQLLAAGLDAGEFEHITTANPARLLCS